MTSGKKNATMHKYEGRKTSPLHGTKEEWEKEACSTKGGRPAQRKNGRAENGQIERSEF